MKEYPILFSAAMVRAILAGTKTQTRRVFKYPSWSLLPDDEADLEGDEPRVCSKVSGCLARVQSPYGWPGDRLWVRETHSRCRWQNPGERYVVLKDGTQIYESGERFPGLKRYAPGAFDYIKWKPSIHLPRWASRLTLEVVSVRVERLQEITDTDAIAEGIGCNPSAAGVPMTKPHGETLPRVMFHDLWDSLNVARGFGWNLNPWVWVIEFRRIDGGEPA